MVGVYNIVIRDNKVLKYLNRQNEVGKKLYKRLKNRKHQLIFRNIIENTSNNYIIGKYIVRGNLINNYGNYNPPENIFV